MRLTPTSICIGVFDADRDLEDGFLGQIIVDAKGDNSEFGAYPVFRPHKHADLSPEELVEVSRLIRIAQNNSSQLWTALNA